MVPLHDWASFVASPEQQQRMLISSSSAMLFTVPMIGPYDLPSHLPDWPLHLVEQRLSAAHHGNFERWMRAVAFPTDLTQSCTYPTPSVLG